MLAAQRGYQLAADATILCDPEEADADWEAGVSLEGLRGTAGEGWERARGVMEGFRDVRQEVYKVRWMPGFAWALLDENNLQFS